MEEFTLPLHDDVDAAQGACGSGDAPLRTGARGLAPPNARLVER
jgi:hypothetical protein